MTDVSVPQTWSLANLGGEPGEFTFSVVAKNSNGAAGEAATTPKLVVGTPGSASWAASSPVVAAAGTATLTWTAPAYNAKIGTRYYVQLWRADGVTQFGSPVALTPAQGGEGTEQKPFTATISVTAGSWSYQLLTSNAWGAGEASQLTGPVTQREWEHGVVVRSATAACKGYACLPSCLRLRTKAPQHFKTPATPWCSPGGHPCGQEPHRRRHNRHAALPQAHRRQQPGHHRLPRTGVRAAGRCAAGRWAAGHDSTIALCSSAHRSCAASWNLLM